MIMIYDANVPMVLFVVNDVQHIENNGWVMDVVNICGIVYSTYEELVGWSTRIISWLADSRRPFFTSTR